MSRRGGIEYGFAVYTLHFEPAGAAGREPVRKGVLRPGDGMGILVAPPPVQLGLGNAERVDVPAQCNPVVPVRALFD